MCLKLPFVASQDFEQIVLFAKIDAITAAAVIVDAVKE